MMKRKILIILLVIGGITGYVHYNLEHYFFYYITTYDKHNGTFSYINGLVTWDKLRLPRYQIKTKNDLLGVTDNYIFIRNKIKLGDLIVISPGYVDYYQDGNQTKDSTQHVNFDEYGRVDYFSEPLSPKLKKVLSEVRDDFQKTNKPRINLQWIFNLKMAVENQLIKLIDRFK